MHALVLCTQKYDAIKITVNNWDIDRDENKITRQWTVLQQY